MSEIDTVEHFFLGYFYGVPLYQPLETGCIGKSCFENNECNISYGKLIIGGGDGEHPAIIFHDIEFCVAKWLLYFFSEDELSENILSAIKDIISHRNLNDIMEYCKWDNETHRLFFNNCMNGYDTFSDEFGFEEWMVLNIGEFVYISMFNISDTIADWHNAIGEIEEGINLFIGITVPPPGYRNVLGFATNPSTLKKEDGISRFKVIDNWPDYHKKV